MELIREVSLILTKNTAESIAAHLRLSILRGDLKSNEPLRQDKIAEELGVSKVPVREALVQLKAEGLVTLYTNRGAFISALTAAEASEIYTIRIALETVALEAAIPHLTAPILMQAENILRVMDVETDTARWNELNWDFHAQLYQAAQMPRLISILEPLHMNVARYLVLYLKNLGFQATSQQEHYAILQACRDGNVTQAVGLLRQHLLSASTTLATFLMSET
ncbi:MAG: GntR family transcriptional regulator [Chloroflexi bacterium]|nr:GntR family transcriptional regulator [Chloroflexota bacterium]